MNKDLEKLKVYANEFINNDCDFDPDKLYTYAITAQSGEIEEDPKNVDYILRSILYFFCRDENFADVIEKYPLTLRYLSDIASGIGTQVLYDLAWYYREELENDEKFFEVVDLGAQTYPEGLSGGMGLVNQLIYNDLCCLQLARCYKDGRGVKKDYPMALRHYLRYRTDHLCQKWADDQLQDEELADLYAGMKAESDAGVNYPGLHLALAVMSAEGFGAPYDIEAYRKYYEKEMENYENGANEDFGYRELMEDYYLTKKVYDTVKEADADSIQIGDVIRLGKYNHRDVLWHVVHTEPEKALLLSADCLESNYIVQEKQYFSIEDEDRSKIPNFLATMKYDLFFSDDEEDEGPDYRDFLLPNQEEDYVFLLGCDEITKYHLPSDVLLAGAREQAKINGYDGCGVDVDEETGASPWWTSTDGDKEGCLVFVNGNGEFEEAPMQMEGIGIRPAVWLKLKK